jgi:heme A synthase
MLRLRRALTILVIELLVLAPFLCPQYCHLKASVAQSSSPQLNDPFAMCGDASMTADAPTHQAQHGHGEVGEILHMLYAMTTFVVVASLLVFGLILSQRKTLPNLILRKIATVVPTPPPRFAHA